MTKQIPLSQGRFTLVDDSDYDWLNQWKWHYKTCGYAARSVTVNGQSKKIYMHRQIMNAQTGQVVDHCNGDGLDNRRNNLRIVTVAQNVRNRRPVKNHNSYKGIYWHKGNKKWHARIQFEGRRFELGYYHDADMAARAYDAASRRLHGRYGRCNFPDDPIPLDIQSKVTTYLARQGIASESTPTFLSQ